MSTIAELSRKHVYLPPQHILHLQHLVAEWELLADLYYSDLLLWVPVDDDAEHFVTLAHVRPTNTDTMYRQDPVGQTRSSGDRPSVARAWRSGEICEGDLNPPAWPEPGVVEAVPVRRFGDVIAVLTRDRLRDVARRTTPLQTPYAEAGRALTQMIAEGTFPYRSASPVLTETIRAGDGFIRLNAEMRIEYASPNAVSALHRLGAYEQLEKLALADSGLNDAAIRAAVSTSSPGTDEIEEGDVSVLLLALPLVHKGTSTGALVLVRDVSEIRRRDRLLLSKEAAIREIHHRVKNNLQTIASFLRLQARRTDSTEARTALEESVRRIRSISLVHELLSREASGWLPFNSILQPLVRDVDEGLVGERRIRIEITGDAGMLPADVATSLAVILTELLQNAVEHAFPSVDDDGFASVPDEDGLVSVGFTRVPGELTVEVEDNGVGFPSGFDADSDIGLGLRIVRELVGSELDGSFKIFTAVSEGDGGATIAIRLPVRLDPVADPELAGVIGSGPADA